MLHDITLPRPPVRARRRPADRLREALLELAGNQAAILAHHEQPWASVTFAGARHRLELLFDGAAAVAAGELFIAFLPEHEFGLPGHLVADAAVTEVDHRRDPPRLQVTCEILLLEEG
jgi:hypothetical protein